MINEGLVETGRKLRILVAPLDWGLGHATRCIPVIYELIRQDVEVWIAATGAQEIVLKDEFPTLSFLSLEGYRVHYGAGAAGVLRALLWQLPRLSKCIRREHAWLQEMVDVHSFDAVISDNRFGLYHQRIPCVYITHQLQVKTPFGKWAERLTRKLHYRFIHRFTECWVPDDQNQFAGELAHPGITPEIPVFYIGILSRLKKVTANLRPRHLVILLSGPEPQRSLLEDIIVEEISHYKGTATVLRGLPGAEKFIPGTNDIRFFNHLPATSIAGHMQEADYIICRSGYSSVMDIVSLEKKAIFIPTPGQTEQEYLARHLTSKGVGCFVHQDAFRLNEALKLASQFAYRQFSLENNPMLADVVRAFLQRLRQNNSKKKV